MKALLKEQFNIFDRMTKSVRNYKKDSESRKTKSYLQIRLKLLADLWDTFNANHEKLLAEDIPEDERYVKNDLPSEIEEFYVTNMAEIQEYLNTNFPEKPIEQFEIRQPSDKKPEEKLPTIKLPIFTGKYEDWGSFRDLFSCLIGENGSLSNVQKLYYLKTHLSGEAEQLIKHFQVTEANYGTAWKVLKDRFENKRVQVNSELRILLSQPKITSDTAQSIKSLIDTSERCIQSLANLEIPVNQWDAILVHILTQKLSHESLQLWEQSLVAKTEVPTFVELKTFLVGRFRTLEAISPKGYARSELCRQTHTKAHHSFKSDNCQLLCDNEHKVIHCPKFIELPIPERLKFVYDKKLCFNCLSSRHHVRQCSSKFSCLICKKKHHTQLHDAVAQKRNEAGSREPQTVMQAETSDVAAHFLKNSQGKQVLLSTALVKIFNPEGNEIVARALLDQGSQSTFLTENISQMLHLQKFSISARICGIGKSTYDKCNKLVTFGIKSMSGESIVSNAEALVLRSLTHYGQNLRVKGSNWKHLYGLNLADPYYANPGKIDIIIGADLFPAILLEGIVKGPTSSPLAQNTRFGWVLIGPVSSIEENPKSIEITNLHTITDLHRQLQTFWELEEITNVRQPTNEDLKCEEIFQSTCVRLNKRYQVNLPFKENSEALGESKRIATSRFLHLESKFETNAHLGTDYSNCMNEYLQLNHMVEIEPHKIDLKVDESGFHGFYLPYHTVYKEDSSTTKIRVVFNASQKSTSGTSLNDKLLTGPNIQENMSAILLRWRIFKIVFTADIEKMYRQILVSEDHTDYQRIVWRSSKYDSLKDYKLLRVTFGMDCSAYLAIRVLKQLAEDEKTSFPLGSKILTNDFYVDNLMSGADNYHEASEKKMEIIDILKEGGFNLRKWSSNINLLLEDIPQHHREISDNKPINFETTIKTLGLQWNPKQDYFYFKLKFTPEIKSPTKRSILSDVSRLYDPLGWIAPITIVGKILMQSLWLTGLDWDNEIPDDIHARWTRYASQLHELEAIKIPRWVGYLTSSIQQVEIHVFCDSSIQAYAATIYISIYNGKTQSTRLLISKTRVAPLKPVSLPRLELCGAVLAAKLTSQVLTDLRLVPDRIYAWTDSTIVLAWLRAPPTRWKTFVANRVAEIHEKLKDAHWRYVPSNSNPSDLGTRGIAARDLIENDLWWSGPAWIAGPKESWPREVGSVSTDLDERKVTLNSFVEYNNDIAHVESKSTVKIEEMPLNSLILRYSSLKKLVRVNAWCLRFIHNCKVAFSKRLTGYLSAAEFQNSTTHLVKLVQNDIFKSEIKCLRSKRPLPVTNPFVSLSIFLDDDGFIRVGGRLEHSTLPNEQKHQILLPKDHHLTNLIIKHYHEEALHAGTQATLSLIRQRYWFKSGRDKVRKIIFSCMVCFRNKTHTSAQIMGNLPKQRVISSRPFQNIGLDFAGPITMKPNLKRSKITLKAYIAIFICFSTKAIHLEIVSELSTDAFLASLRRFIARRSKPSNIFCDNATNFKGCKNLLESQLEIYKSESVQNYSAEKGIKWNFIPPLGPHHGGLWESNIKCMKTHLVKIAKAAILNFEELSTLIAQIEACLNSRPLTALSSDPTDLEPLTPGHFLIGGPLLSIPDPNTHISMSLLSRWNLVQAMQRQFWTRWSLDYLNELQTKSKWTKAKPNLKIGQLVLLKDSHLPPMKWSLARIEKVFPGPDGYVRVVEVRTSSGIYKRPITRICLLPEQK